jgi:hypothetical protein
MYIMVALLAFTFLNIWVSFIKALFYLLQVGQGIYWVYIIIWEVGESTFLNYRFQALLILGCILKAFFLKRIEG